MFYVALILIVGLWAAFLLPSFFDHRRRAPKTTTRDFARTKKVLEQVAAAQPDSQAYVRYHSQLRRQRILIGLGSTALFALVVATLTGAAPWLWLTIALDVAFAGYVALLLQSKQQRSVPQAAIVSIETVQPTAPTLSAVPEFEESPTVRVIAG